MGFLNRSRRPPFCLACRMVSAKRFVYVLKNASDCPSLLRRGHLRRAIAIVGPQCRPLFAYGFKTPLAATSDCAVRRRSDRPSLRALPEVRLRPRLREAAFRSEGRPDHESLSSLDSDFPCRSALVQRASQGTAETMPPPQAVPSGTNLVHHPSLMSAGEGCRAEASQSDA